MLEQSKTAVKGVNAAPGQTQQEVNDNNCFTSLISLICGPLLKEINDTVPPPTETAPLKATLNGRWRLHDLVWLKSSFVVQLSLGLVYR